MTAIRRLGAVAAGVAVALGPIGCGDDGRDLRPPTAEVAPPVVPEPAKIEANPPAGSNEGNSGLALSSPVFVEGGPVAEQNTCRGANVPPPLAWSGVPVGTVELAITVTDPDANGFVHWVVAAIDPAVTGISGEGIPEGAIETTNDLGDVGWFGPCPPHGESHRYVFSLYALSAPSGVEAEMDGADAIARIAATPGLAATLTGTYTSP